MPRLSSSSSSSRRVLCISLIIGAALMGVCGSTIDAVLRLNVTNVTRARLDAIDAAVTALVAAGGVPLPDSPQLSIRSAERVVDDGAALTAQSCQRPGAYGYYYYSDPANGTCHVCTTCAATAFRLRACTATQDAVCIAQCPPGTYIHSGGICMPCPAGWFSAAAGATACAPCDAGTYSNASGATACATCPWSTGGGGVGARVCMEVRARASMHQPLLNGGSVRVYNNRGVISATDYI